MNRSRWITILLIAAFSAVLVVAAAGAKDEKAKSVTVVGEIVDTGCFLGHGAMGQKHAECASKCIAGGMPMGLLTAKNEFYLLTPPHENTDAYENCKKWAAKSVEVTGQLMARDDVKAIEVASAKPAGKTEAKPQSKY